MKVTTVILLILTCAACVPGHPSVEGETSAMSADGSSAESETSEGGDGDGDPDTNTSNPFVAMQDFITGCECDPFMQDCADGEKCVPYASSGNYWDANKCVPVLGEQAAGEPCTLGGIVESTDDCDATSFCWAQLQDHETLGTCRSFCSGTADMPGCPGGHYCPIAGDGAINLCFPICDPLAQDCADGLGCYWTSGAFTCVFTQEPGVGVGQPCGYANDCLPGNLCADAATLPGCEGSMCCTPYCNVELGDQSCEVLPGTACVPFFEQGATPMEYEHVGVCLVPP